MEKQNGNGNGKEKGQLSPETKAEIEKQQEGAEKAVAKATRKQTKKGKAEGKPEKGKGKGKLIPFEAKPVPEAVKGLVAEIEKVKDLENLKAVARSLQRHFKKVYVDACQKAVDGLKAGNVVWFKKGAQIITGKVVKVKSNGRVKIESEEGKKWKVPGTMVHKGKPTGADRAEVTKKAA